MKRCVVLFLGLLCVSAAPSRADTIELAETGMKLEGKVQRDIDDYIVFILGDNTGTLRIPKSKIKNIEYDIKTQLANLKEDDYAGRYKVGLWAMERNMFPEAIELFEELEGKEGPGSDRLKHLGKAYEQRKQLDKALQNYSDYLKIHPEDSAIAEHVKTLSKEVNPDDAAAVTPDGKPAKPKHQDGLEGDGQWIVENWGIAGKAQFTLEPNTGNKMIVVQSDGGDKDKVAISRTGPPLDLSDSKEMIVRMFHNGPAPMGIAVAFINTQGEFHESRAIRVPPNTWFPFSQKMDGKQFKANRNNFKDYDLEIEGKERVTRMVFLVYGAKPFTLYLDGVYFKQKTKE